MKKTTNIPLVRCFAFPHKNVLFKGWYFLSFSLLHTRVLLILTLCRCLYFLVNVHINENGCKIVRQRLSFRKWTNRSIFKKGGKYRSYCGKVQIILSWKKCKCNAPFQLLVICISCCTSIAYTSSWTEVWGKNQNWIGDIYTSLTNCIT